MVGYNVQAAVDAKHHLIVAHEVNNIGNDRSQLSTMAKQVQAATGVRQPTFFTQPASEIVGTVSPCLPGAASCESCLPRHLERFVGARWTRLASREEKRGSAPLDGRRYIRLKRVELQIELIRDGGQTDLPIKT